MAQDPGQIREAIEETRADIARTMEALGQKADVKQRLRQQVRDKGDNLKTQVSTQGERLATKWQALNHPVQADGRPPHETPMSADTRQKALAIGLGFLAMMLILRRVTRD